MKKIVLILLMALYAIEGNTQVVIPTIEGKFGVDADAQKNIFIDATSPCSDCDDWWYEQVSNGGNSLYIIDTTGAGAIVAGYLSNPAATANVPFYRKMRYPAFTQNDERTLIDAIFVRDYHGSDQTAFVDGSNKNADHPTDWRGDTKSVLDKNDILDVYCHLRRQGTNYNTTDNLWLFGAVAIEGTNGDRYFDFEMYQTDIFYTRSTTRFTGYGPDAGHTSWRFDGSGNITQAGDIIFAANFSTSGLTDIEARIWVDRAVLSTVPATFNWTGTFDGATPSAQYGYAGIQPKFGDPFYYGTLNSGPTWAGPYRVARANNSVVTQYAAGQFMEFGVNLTTLGLNPTTLMGEAPCGIPFSKVMVKTRSSTSFTSELKDFIAPFDLFLPPTADLAADVPVFCGATSISNIWVTDPYSTSTYAWTHNGRIVNSNSDSTSLTVDSAGTYIVTQLLGSGCPLYSSDTVVIAYDPSCAILPSNKITFNGLLNNGLVNLDWKMISNEDVKYFTIEKSIDGVHFTYAGKVEAINSATSNYVYKSTDEVFGLNAQNVYYRIKISGIGGDVQYSKMVKLSLSLNGISAVSLVPNPVRNQLQVNIASNVDKDVQVFIYDITGTLMKTTSTYIQKGYSTIKLSGFESWARGVYTVKVVSGQDLFVERMLLTK
jgi:hypothetical protein